jgi:phospholipid/cholesterol/gamma-HCH transport system ATP-binding protein
MIGLLRPVTGRILFDGEDIVTAEGEDRLRLLRKFGVMYQSGALFGCMTVLENVRLPLDEFTDIGAGEKDLVAEAKLVGVCSRPPAETLGAVRGGGSGPASRRACRSIGI